MDLSGYPLTPYETHSNQGFSIPRKAVFSHESDEVRLIDSPHQFSGYHGGGEPQEHFSGLPTSTSNHPTHRRLYGSVAAGRTSLFLWWSPEILSSTISLGCLVATVAVLRHYDGRGIQDLNLPYSLTLNGIVAAISTINRVALMVPVASALSQEAWLWFAPSRHAVTGPARGQLRDLELSDAASRGAWGSLIFLLKARRRYLAYLGALITIISLAFGTFTQQLLAFQNFPIAASQPSLLPGNIPRSETWQIFSGNPAEAALTTSLKMKAAMYSGMFTQDSTPLIAACPTGNCTWPVTPSLAVCGECVHQTFQMTGCNTTTCNYTMPSGTVMGLANLTATDEGYGFQVTSGSGSKYNASLDDRLYIANFDVFGAPWDSYSEISSPFEPNGTISSECAMWMCVEAYDVATLSSQQQQFTVQNFSSLPYNLSLIGSGGNFTFPPLPASMNPTPSTNYTVGFLPWAALSQEMTDLCDGRVFLNLEGNTPSSDAIQAIWNASSNLDPWVKNAAASMTNVIRAQTPVSLDRYNGLGSQLGVNVRWEWLVLPASMVALSLLLFAIVVVKTARSPVGAWKGSPLAVLFFDVDPEIKERVGAAELERYRGIEGAVGRTKVGIRRQQGGTWRFEMRD